MTGQAKIMRIACSGLLLLLAACATTRPAPTPTPSATGDASWRAVVPPGTTRYQLALGEISSGGTPFKRVTPIYPAKLLALCPPPEEVPALLIVDGEGVVGEVRVADEAQADPARRAFIAATRAAARQWEFSPLQINHWAADANGGSHVVDSATKPFSLDYVFRFECHAGKPTVSSSATP